MPAQTHGDFRPANPKMASGPTVSDAPSFNNTWAVMERAILTHICR